MPFDAGGTFTRSYNWQQDRDAGIKILAQRMDGEFNNYAGGLNQTFLRTGIVPMGGPLNMNSNPIVGVAGGTLVSPGLRFESDTDTGIMQSGPGNLTLVVDGVARMTATSSGVSVAGPLTLSSGDLIISGGVTKFPDGAVGAPGISFSAAPTTGIWRTGTGAGESLNIAIAGSNRISVQPAVIVVNGAITATGTITSASTITGASVNADANFWMSIQGGIPIINFDANDYMRYDRTGNQFNMFIGGANVFQVTANNVQLPTTSTTIGNAGAGLLYIGDANQYMQLTGTTAKWQWDTNDVMLYDRTGNQMNLYINNVIQFAVNGSGVIVGGALNVTGLVSSLSQIRAKNSPGGGVELVGVGATHTGYLSFIADNLSRKGYIGFINQTTNSVINYINEMSPLNGAYAHSFVGGPVAFDSMIQTTGDVRSGGVVLPGNATDFYLSFNGGAPLFVVDAGDYFFYDRGANAYNWVIGAANILSVKNSGIVTPVGFQSPQVSVDANFYMNINSGAFTNYDSNDYMRYDRAGNQWNWVINGVTVSAVNTTGVFVPMGGIGGTLSDAGYKYRGTINMTGNTTITNAYADRLIHVSGGAGQILTLPIGVQEGTAFDLVNFSAGAMTLTPGAGAALYWVNNSGTNLAGARSVAQNVYTRVSFFAGNAWIIRSGGPGIT